MSKPTSVQQGTRILPAIEMEIDYTATVSEVKRRVLEAMGLDGENESKSRRFRATNWSQEAGALVEEVELVVSREGRVLLERTMESIEGLVAESMLLLEEGEVPIIGVKCIDVYLWKPSMNR